MEASGPESTSAQPAHVGARGAKFTATQRAAEAACMKSARCTTGGVETAAFKAAEPSTQGAAGTSRMEAAESSSQPPSAETSATQAAGVKTSEATAQAAGMNAAKTTAKAAESSAVGRATDRRKTENQCDCNLSYTVHRAHLFGFMCRVSIVMDVTSHAGHLSVESLVITSA